MAGLRAADSFLTTEKDFVRLKPAQRAMLTAVAPLNAVKLNLRLRDEAALMEQLLSRVSIRSQHSI
jgi:tetraacyldisaccharide-1-P 4'-kinase